MTAAAAAVPLWFVFQFGFVFVSWIASGFAGYAVGRAVRAGAEGNGAPPFVTLSIAIAILSVAGAWVAYRILIPPGLGSGTYLAAGYGAWLVYR